MEPTCGTYWIFWVSQYMTNQFFTCFLFNLLPFQNMRIMFIRNITNLLIIDDIYSV